MLLLTALGVRYWPDGGMLVVLCVLDWRLVDAAVLPTLVRNPPG